jgi:hypothetical protein
MSGFGDKAKQIIGSVAPMLGTVLGGPLGGLAGSMLAKALGTDDPKAQETMITSGDPEILLKLKAAESELQEHMRELDIDEEKLHFDDTANARAMQVATHDSTPQYLAYLITFGFFATLGYLIVYGKPQTGGDVMLVMVGALGTAWANIVSFYYGSSAGSAAKTDVINKIAASK